jgi:hypothetical protein
MGKQRNVYRLLVGIKGKRPLESRRMDKIKMEPGKVGWGDVDWIDLAQDRNRWRAFANAVKYLRVP